MAPPINGANVFMSPPILINGACSVFHFKKNIQLLGSKLISTH